MTDLIAIGKRAKLASRELCVMPTKQKNEVLTHIATAIRENCAEIINANQKDIDIARKNGISESLIDRLSLNESRINSIADAVLDVVKLDDPVGKIDGGITRPNGLVITKKRVPMGVIGIIYEARPNVTVDAAVLCFKSGNAVILKGGKEAFHSNICLANIMRDAIKKAGANPDAVILIEDTDRAVTTELMRLNAYLDVLIPRGSASLINAVVQNATVPVIETGVGNCHIFVDDTSNLDMAAEIINNAKTSRPSVCNAAETLLVHKNIAKDFLPKAKALLDKSNCEIRGCEQTKSILGESVSLATEDDYATEFLDYILAVKVVDSVDEAIAHITKYSTHHSECIVTNNLANANKFTNMVDAAAVYVNASTRFTDGGEFGLGAEIGISTQKLHARGPMGLCELTTIKFVVSGNGQIR